MIIESAKHSDIPSLLDIYNYEVLNGVATLDINPRTYEDREKWFLDHGTALHPLFVAREGDEILGYASLSSYRQKEAYKSTAELSVYIGAGHRGNGVATALLERIIEFARQNGEIHNIVSVITSGNLASVRLHEKFGFRFCGTLHEVGTKFGKYLDIDNYELII